MEAGSMPHDRKEYHSSWWICACGGRSRWGPLKDLIVGHYGPVQILKNTGSSFIDVTKEYGILEEGSVKSAAVDDLDNDGDKDIIFCAS